MVRQISRHSLGVIVMGVLVLSMVGCGTPSSTTAKDLEILEGKDVDLSNYQTLTLVDFVADPAGTWGKGVDKSECVKFGRDVAMRLENDYGPLFSRVRVDEPPLGQADELILTGKITEYNPGSKFGRMMLIGVGAAGFKGEVYLENGATRERLLAAKIDKVWAWGGILGGSKGIEEMVIESAASAAITIAHRKGWTKESQETQEKDE